MHEHPTLLDPVLNEPRSSLNDSATYCTASSKCLFRFSLGPSSTSIRFHLKSYKHDTDDINFGDDFTYHGLQGGEADGHGQDVGHTLLLEGGEVVG